MELQKNRLLTLSEKFKENLKKIYNKTIDDLCNEGYLLIGNMDIRTHIYDPRLQQFLLNFNSFDPSSKVEICNGNCEETKQSKGGQVKSNLIHSHCICEERILNTHFIINKNFNLKSIIVIGICCAERFIENFDTKRRCIINNCNNLVNNRFYCDKNKLHLNYSLCKEHKYYEKCVYCNEMTKVDKNVFNHFKNQEYFQSWRNKINCDNCNKILDLKKKINLHFHIQKCNRIKKLLEIIDFHLKIIAFDKSLVDFGKYKGKTWKYVKENQKSYCQYINDKFDKKIYKDLLFYLNLK